jgi:heptosyltransferase-2
MKIDLQTIKKILIIRLSSMGDVILTSNLTRCLKNQFPQAQIDYLVSTSFTEVILNNPYINNIIEYRKDLSFFDNLNFKNKLLKEHGQWDLIIDLQNNLRSGIFSFNAGKYRLKVKKNRLHKLSLVYFKKSLINDFSVPFNYLNTVLPVGVRDDNEGLELWLPEEKNNPVYPPLLKDKKDPDCNNKIAVAPGAYHFTKRMPPDKFVELINLLSNNGDFKFVLIGGKSDKDICDYIALKVDRNIENKSGSISIAETTRIIDSCSLLITNDTGVMHIAAARRKPIVAIFGSTVPEFGFSPFRVPNKIVINRVLCQPCTHIGRAKCPKGHFNCMNKIDILKIIKAVEELLNK